jgi:hypothetical protein
MFKVEEITLLNWDGRYLINLKNDKTEGKTTKSVVEKMKIGRREKNKARAMTKCL